MLGKKVKSRIFFLVFSLVLFASIIFVILRSLEENVVYFLSPTEIYDNEKISFEKTIRVGGLVKMNSINKNETVAIVGKSGSGKSVLLKCIIGLLNPDRGSIKIYDQEITL